MKSKCCVCSKKEAIPGCTCPCHKSQERLKEYGIQSCWPKPQEQSEKHKEIAEKIDKNFGNALRALGGEDMGQSEGSWTKELVKILSKYIGQEGKKEGHYLSDPVPPSTEVKELESLIRQQIAIAKKEERNIIREMLENWECKECGGNCFELQEAIDKIGE